MNSTKNNTIEQLSYVTAKEYLRGAMAGKPLGARHRHVTHYEDLSLLLSARIVVRDRTPNIEGWRIRVYDNASHNRSLIVELDVVYAHIAWSAFLEMVRDACLGRFDASCWSSSRPRAEDVWKTR